jgi:hypothetical protein
MKAQINLRSTLSNTTSVQRGSAALAALVLMALIGALLIYLSRPSAQAIPTARVSVPAPRVSPNVPVIGTGSVYDGGHYGGLRPAPRVSPNVPVIGTGSVYDGGHYGSAIPTGSATIKRLGFGTGSVYDGGHYGSAVSTGSVTIKQLGFGTGSVYDGGHYGSKWPATNKLNVPISGTGSVYDGGHYGSVVPIGSTTVKRLDFGTGSVYNEGN